MWPRGIEGRPPILLSMFTSHDFPGFKHRVVALCFAGAGAPVLRRGVPQSAAQSCSGHPPILLSIGGRVTVWSRVTAHISHFVSARGLERGEQPRFGCCSCHENLFDTMVPRFCERWQFLQSLNGVNDSKIWDSIFAIQLFAI